MRATLTSSIMPRTTLDLDEVVLRRLRDLGRREHKSMGQVASELLAPAITREEAVQEPLKLIRRHMGTPAIDLDDKEALGRMLDSEHLEKLRR